MSDKFEAEKNYFPIPKPLSDMSIEERREFATELATFMVSNIDENHTQGLQNSQIKNFEVKQKPRIKSFVYKFKKPFSVLTKVMRKHVLSIAFLAFILGVLGVYLGVGPFLHYNNTNPAIDGYVPPRSIMGLVNHVQNSTVTVFCDFTSDNYMQGSGWAIEIPLINQKEFPNALITNYHVIEKCLNKKSKISIKVLGGKEFPAYLDRWDTENDLAVLGTKARIPVLELSQWKPFPGFWVMAVGTADGHEGSIAFGNVLNTSDSDVLITAAISHGNSGGPLVDNEGKVVGVNTWRSKDEQYNGAVSLDALCVKIMKCDSKYFWPRS